MDWLEILKMREIDHGLEMIVVDMTPELAQYILSRNESNRNIRKAAVNEYRESMRKGYWRLTGQGICLSRDGVLLDGQHRLTAVVQEGISIEMPVIIGVESGAQQYQDSGTKRTQADNLKMFDGEKNTARLVAMCKVLRLLDEGAYKNMVIDDTREMISEYREQFDWLNEQPYGEAPKLSSFLAPILWIHAHGYDDEATLFFHEMSTLEGLTAKSPVLALKKAIDRRGSSKGIGQRTLEVTFMTFNALKAYVDEEKIMSKGIQFSTTGYDYFANEIFEMPSRRSNKNICMHHRPCRFEKSIGSGGRLIDVCWLHSNFGKSRVSKKM